MSRPEINHPDLPLGVLFDLWPATVPVFLTHSMLCFGCPIAPFHTVMDACREYRLDEGRFRAELNLALTATDDGTVKRTLPCRQKP